MRNKHFYPDERSGVCVVRRKDETIEELIRRFKKKFSKSGIVKELRDRMYYEKPSETKRKKRLQAIRNARKDELMRETFYNNIDKNSRPKKRNERKGK